MPDKKKGGRGYRPPKECREFGKVLHGYRKRLGLSVEQVAEMIGYKNSTIWGLEAGEGFSSSLTAAVPRVYQLNESDSKRWLELRQMMMARNKHCSCMKPPAGRFNYAEGSLAERVTSFGRLLAMKRYKMGLSQTKFAKAKALSLNYVRILELGGRFSAAAAERVPEAYGLSLEETEQFKTLCEEAKRCMHPGRNLANFKGALYIYTDGTKYEFPIYVARSIYELALLVGVSDSYISKALSDYYRFGFNTRYRTTLEPVSDNDEIEEQRIKDYIEKRYGVCPP